MNQIRQFISAIPAWAFVIVLIIVAFHLASLYMISSRPLSGETEHDYEGHYIIDYIKKGGPVDKAGIKPGDTIVSCNGYLLDEWYVGDHGQQAGDTLRFGMIYNGRLVEVPVVITSNLAMYPFFYYSIFFIFVLFNIGSLFILYKKPGDRSAVLFFLVIQQFSALSIGGYSLVYDPIHVFIALIFLAAGATIGPTLVYFHLIFPKPLKLIEKYRYIPLALYATGIVLLLLNLYSHYRFFMDPTADLQEALPFERFGMLFLVLMFVLAIIIAFYQLYRTKDTLTRNQLRIVVLGTFFGLVTDIAFFIFYEKIYTLWDKYPNLVQISQGTGSLILIVCVLIAIFRFRIWNMELVIRKIFLYLSATVVILLSYLVLLYLVDRFTNTEATVTRFVILAVSVMIFLITRDRIQKLIDKIFHRENYDSATVVADFEEKLAGTYRIEDLGSKIAEGMDDIFHFRSFALNLRKEDLIYELVSIIGTDHEKIPSDFAVDRQFEEKLIGTAVFSPAELKNRPEIADILHSELVIPILKEGRPHGFFLCGPKKSEKVYSMQDIRVLSLIARRVYALFHTAALYQKDLERQLLLERERARIAQDMHDDIGAGLTKIAMMSERVSGGRGILRPAERDSGQELNPEREQMMKVATAAREMVTRLNVIVWALNPRNDNLDSLISYARRYFGEYLENFRIDFRMTAPDEVPDIAVTPDFRRNAFYAWQEAIHNAVKHSACSEVRLEISIESRVLVAIITDNGKGFDLVKPGSGGNGLLNMRKRAVELGGTFAIESKVDEGTMVKFEIPILKL